MNYQKYLGSSANPDNLSMTVKSVGVWLIPAVLALAVSFGWDVKENDLVELVNNLAILTAAAMTIYGLGRKIFLKFKK